MSTQSNSAIAGKRGINGKTRKIVMTAMLSAIAFILMFIEFPIPFLIPSFVKMDISELPALIGAFSMGPVAGIAICVLKNILHIIIKGTSSAYAGEICNCLLGIMFVVPAGIIYNKLKKADSPELAKKQGRKAALIGCLVGAAVMAIASVPINYFITYPAYVKFYGLPLDAIIGMYQELMSSANSLIKCLVIFNMPFTFLKGILDSVLTFLIYKRISVFIKGK
jgi:riboflavin transporter FmnP